MWRSIGPVVFVKLCLISKWFYVGIATHTHFCCCFVFVLWNIMQVMHSLYLGKHCTYLLLETTMYIAGLGCILYSEIEWPKSSNWLKIVLTEWSLFLDPRIVSNFCCNFNLVTHERENLLLLILVVWITHFGHAVLNILWIYECVCVYACMSRDQGLILDIFFNHSPHYC